LKQYTRAEYEKFTPAEKAKHYQLKKKGGHYDEKRKVAELETSDANVEMALGNNSNNPALVRQGKIPKTEK
jgi:hypothetical protein